ncbi:acetyltransferase [Paenibacillus rhizovicinus]|uniref:Acetyltransferase n=2 Tax=Paenibacillus rhizovicinus TaxID=2704463 RepID=A0A6C0PA18_9BACL|nr:acetyltransferase [Paenibacillus rhizovicinus]
MASSTESSKPPVVPLIIAGRGGHGQVVRDIAEATGRFAVIAVVDDAFQASELQNDGVWHCSVDFVPELLRAHPDGQVIIAIGSNHVRRQFVGRLALPEARYALLIHPGAHISHRAAVAPGTVVMPGAVVNAGARIGAHAIINSGAVVEHDAIVGAYAHLSPRAAIAGAAIVGEGAQLGIGSSVIPSIEIGEWSVLGAGAAAVKDIPARVLAVGVPAKVRRELD